jgi:hypothetical protein
MLRTALAALAAATAVALAPAAAQAASTAPAPGPLQPQPYAYAVTVEHAYVWNTIGDVDVSTLVTKRTPSMLRSVAAAGEQVLTRLYMDSTYGTYAIGDCNGTTDTAGRLHCVIDGDTFFSTPGMTGMHVGSFLLIGGAAAEKAYRTVDILSHE